MHKALSYCAEIIIFLYLGISMFIIDYPYTKMGSNLLLITIGAVLLGRFVNIYGITLLINKCCANCIPYKFTVLCLLRVSL